MATSKSSRSPAFQFYPKDFLSSSKVGRMTLAERGAYITLLSLEWLDGSLPTDLGILARLVGMRRQQFERMWQTGPLGECFQEHRGRLMNPRLERQRKELAAYLAACAKGGERSAQTRRSRYGTAKPLHNHFRGVTEVTVNTPSASATATASPSTKNGSAEPQNGSTPPDPPMLMFPVVGTNGRTWDLCRSRVDAWTQAFPGLDVPGECRKALAWLEANPTRRKTSRGMPAFLVRWLNRANDNGRGQGPMGPVSASRRPAWAQGGSE